MLRCCLLAVALSAVGADEPRPSPAKPRRFLGSIAVPAERRAEVIDLLQKKGFAGCFVPDGAAPETLLYRGTKADYESALDAANRHLHPEWYRPRVVPKKPAPDR